MTVGEISASDSRNPGLNSRSQLHLFTEEQMAPGGRSSQEYLTSNLQRETLQDTSKLNQAASQKSNFAEGCVA